MDMLIVCISSNARLVQLHPTMHKMNSRLLTYSERKYECMTIPGMEDPSSRIPILQLQRDTNIHNCTYSIPKIKLSKTQEF
jgi:hypothetical protein